MKFGHQYFITLCVISAVLAAISLTLASMYVDRIVGVGKDGVVHININSTSWGPTFKSVWKECRISNGTYTAEMCKYFKLRFAAGTLGIMIGILQFLTAITLIPVGSNYGYTGAHVFFAVLSIIVFVIILSDYNKYQNLYSSLNHGALVLTTISVAMIEAVFCLSSAIFSIILEFYGEKDKHSEIGHHRVQNDIFDEISLSFSDQYTSESDDDDDINYKTRDNYGENEQQDNHERRESTQQESTQQESKQQESKQQESKQQESRESKQRESKVSKHRETKESKQRESRDSKQRESKVSKHRETKESKQRGTSTSKQRESKPSSVEVEVHKPVNKTTKVTKKSSRDKKKQIRRSKKAKTAKLKPKK